ncbi:hypothetical protein [Sulfobacillus harzensis]|uniref:Uncharacterized protein n=1 Tax=Sulfobacillus harzensis TaxID=2729629 RepID=A0A7Y0Q1D0_9FIRM|nr:hypothetical protein [Sulfobacillus harzensis]NMP21317.1 hypothetical protein [Sulfobacillus harzensis]
MMEAYPWPTLLDEAMKKLEATPLGALGDWIKNERGPQDSHANLYLLLALASARWVDHHGPYIGHGTFNGAPVRRAASILTPPYQNLALLQTATYVVDLLHHPNYGPYTLMKMDPLQEATPDASQRALMAAIEAGNQPLAAEHRLVGLLKSDSPQSVRLFLLEAALRQFAENEHRLLIIHRAAELLDDTHGWQWAEPVLRPVVQYLASRPGPSLPAETARFEALDLDGQSPPSRGAVEALMDALVNADAGTEPALMWAAAQDAHSASLALEAASLAGAEMLGRSRFDAHAVTGLHAISDLVRDAGLPTRIRALALAVQLTSQRTRRQKAIRHQWHPAASPAPQSISSRQLQEVLLNDPTGRNAWQMAASHLLAGGDPEALARLLIQTALTAAGPFDAIHNVKMVWGQLLETRRSQCPDLAWRHLAAGASAIAVTVNRDEARPVLEVWRRSGLAN